MTLVYGDVEDVAGVPDFMTWFFRSPFRESFDGQSIISGDGEQVIPREDGGRAALGVYLDPGPCFVTYRSKSALIDVPDADSAWIYDLLEDGELLDNPSQYTLLIKGDDGRVLGGELDENSDLVLTNGDGSKTTPLPAPEYSTWVVDNLDGTATIG